MYRWNWLPTKGKQFAVTIHRKRDGDTQKRWWLLRLNFTSAEWWKINGQFQRIIYKRNETHKIETQVHASSRQHCPKQKATLGKQLTENCVPGGVTLRPSPRHKRIHIVCQNLYDIVARNVLWVCRGDPNSKQGKENSNSKSKCGVFVAVRWFRVCDASGVLFVPTKFPICYPEIVSWILMCKVLWLEFWGSGFWVSGFYGPLWSEQTACMLRWNLEGGCWQSRVRLIFSAVERE